MKYNLKKRILSFILAVVMLVGIVPGTAFTASAEEIQSQIENTVAEVESVTLNEETLSLEVGGTSTLEVTVLPEEATDKSVTWESSDLAVATVENGVVTAVAAGTATITAKAGEVSDSCIITVSQPDIEKKIDTETTTETTDPINTEAAIMSLADNGIASVAETDLDVADNVINITDRSVYKFTSKYTTATTLTISGASVISASEDGTTINVVLSGDTDLSAEVTAQINYSGSGCTVSQTGNSLKLTDGSGILNTTIKSYYRMEMLGSGSVTYTINFQCEAVGTKPVDSVKIGLSEGDVENTEINASVPQTTKLKLFAKVFPTDAVSRKFIWKSDDESIATVDGKGVVTGISEGETKIYAVSEVDPTKFAFCTVTVTPKPNNVVCLSYTTSNGSVDTVTFTNSEGGPLNVVSTEVNGYTIGVKLSKAVPLNEKVTATFALTQNNGLPWLSSSNAAAGSSTAVNNKRTVYTITLSGGAGISKAYLYNIENPKVTSNPHETITINYSIVNSKPAIKGEKSAQTTIAAGDSYTVDLKNIFSDEDNDNLTFKYSADGTNYTAINGEEYTFTQNVAGEYTLYFKANDGQTDSDDVYIVTFNVTNLTTKYTTDVMLPQDITPAFYITKEFNSDKTDVLGEALTAVRGVTENGFTKYTVEIPTNISRISVRGTDEENTNWGGMSFVTKDTEGNVLQTSATFTKVTGRLVDYGNNVVDGGLNSASYGEYKAAAGDNRFILCADTEYKFFAVPSDTTSYKSAEIKEKIPVSSEIHTVIVDIPYNNPVTITAPTGAKAQLYVYNKYYDNTEYKSFAVKDNDDGTSTTYFVGTKIPAGGGSFIYRVKYKDYAVKAGWTKNSVTVNFSENDLKENARIDYTTSTDNIAEMAEDNVLLNINGQNNLVMFKGETKTLKAYRAWEIIPVSYNNWIVTPDFHYNIISGGDVVKLADKTSRSTTDTDWKTITALKEGTAVIEVSFDAIDVRGSSSWNGAFGSSDPARTGLMVVQVGGHADVDFGIKGRASQGSLVYADSRAKAWDAEFDTLYFTGDKGELKLSPTVHNGTVQKVQVSQDKGKSWTTITDIDGVYTAPIAHGNNIIRVIANNGEAYQVVRGYKVGVTYKITNDNGNGVVDTGETVRVTFDQIHQPIPKMAGNYNPGYRGNQEGDSGTHIKYTFNETTIEGAKTQYTVPTAANYIDVTIPADTTETSFTLSNGYIATGVIGLTAFANGGDSHRNIPDAGCATRGNETTFHTRSILPDITINIGDNSAPNSAPKAKGDAVNQAQIENGQTYAVNPETFFTDADNDVLTFTYSVNNTDKGTTDKFFKFTPDAQGEYKIVFTASDGKLTAQHTLTLNVVKATQKDTTVNFDIDKSDIKGYVMVSFEDEGDRDDNAIGLKYPEALGTIIAETRVPFAEGDTIAEVTVRLLDAMGIGYEYSGSVTSGFYLGAIENFVVDNTPYVTMGQFDAGEGSGWMITSNDWFIDKGASEFLVEDGDEIRWKYTCQLGSDIGDNSWEKTTKEVEDFISAIGTPVTVDSIGKINAARAAYDALSEFYQRKVSNYNDLLAAEKALESLIKGAATEEDKAAASNVDQLIEEIGTVKLESAEKIEAARAAYENLTALQKELITKLETLETAENTLKQLSSDSHEEVYKNTGNYLANLGIPAVGSTGGEWMVLGLARGNKGLSGTITDGYYNGVSQYMDTVFNGNKALEKAVRFDENKSTENARVILALTAAGIDATKVNRYNLFDGLNEMNYIKYQGVNGPMWALMAFNAHPSYKDEFAVDVSEEKLVQEILGSQLNDGGWDLTNKSADADMTAMAIQALAPYYNSNAAVKEAIDKALSKLSSMQQKDGSFASIDGVNAESTAQVIVALTSLGINPEEDTRFIKKGMSPVDALCNFAVSGGGFMHTPNTARDGMATEQGYYALVSYFRLLNGETSLYDMSDVTLKTGKINPDAPSAYDIAKANEVEKLISAIGKVTLYSNLKIEAARKAYDKLTGLQRKQVENYETLVNAEKKYEKLVDEAVEKVENLIDAIGEVTLESADDITAARRAYNQLPPHIQELVRNLKKLEKAEEELAKLRKEALELIRNGKLVLTKSELLELQDQFENVTSETKYDDALSLLITYFKLGEKQQLALAGSEQLELLKTIVAKQNHENPSTGITMYGLEWNIKVNTDKLHEKDTYIKDEIISKSEGADLLTIWDIYLEDVLTGEKHTLDGVVEVCIPVELVGDYTFYDRLGVVHYADDGMIEILNCKVVDGYVVFNAVDFSYYAVVGFMDVEEESEMTTGTVVVETPEYEELIEKTEEIKNADNNWFVWAGTAGVGIVLLAVLMILKRRMSNEA